MIEPTAELSAATESLSADRAIRAAEPSGPYLVVAFDCSHPDAGAARFSLVGIDEVRIGRGSARRTRRHGRVLVVELADSALSSTHAVLHVSSGRWRIEDGRSKNGTFVNGAAVTCSPLASGDLVDVGRSLCVLVDPGGTADPGDLELGVDGDVMDTVDPALAASFATAVRVASTPIPVLLLGETGTGKELIARALHAHSGRTGSYVAVNCGALPSTLVESELFGTRRGAFSGAVADRLGLVRASDQGTLFLDEIGELPLSSQAVLLRVLQEREVVAIGGHEPVKVDLRVIAATCQDLPAMVASGAFRRDLYARLAGYTLTLPPLRRRRGDLGLLIARLLTRHGSPRLRRDAARAIFRYAWPNNIRELDQVLGVAAVMGDGGIELEHLPEGVRTWQAESAVRPDSAPVDREHLESLLQRHRGNISRVAKVLGTSRSQVRRLRGLFGLPEDCGRLTPPTHN